MDRHEVERRLEAAIERLASIEHERWAHWQRYLHSRGRQLADGSIVIPPELVAQWSRQMDTHYEDLPPEERESDREQVRRYLPAVVEVVAQSR